MFKIICVGGSPCKNVVNKCLTSFVRQSVSDWEMALILDPADYDIYVKDPRITVRINKKSKYSLVNALEALKILDPDDEDVLVFMDADDWLTDDYESLAEVEKVYKEYSNTLVTHGSWVAFPSDAPGTLRPVNNPYRRGEFTNIRKIGWKASQLRTMKYKLFKLIKDDSLRKANGEYFISGHDVAFMFPALEMAGFDRVKFISKFIYVYNKNGVSTQHTHKRQSYKDFKYLKERQSYRRLPKNF